MNDAQIAKLIAKRERLTNRRDSLTNWSIIDRIDQKLAALSPAGQRNDVDRLLGRLCATPSQPTYGAEFYAGIIAAREADAAGETPQFVSLPELMHTATIYNDWNTFIAACDDTDANVMLGDRD